ncbi:Imidazoleglycerol-phosphate dehydratase [Nymphaea thermarum]|nr:Imidazoleglycerol-phosphate dehydratase [Nymphaea thermarum]
MASLIPPSLKTTLRRKLCAPRSDLPRVRITLPKQGKKMVFSAVCSASQSGENSNLPIVTPSSARISEVKRVTKETNVQVKLNLDGTGIADSSTGIPFLDHMLDALLQALGDRKGINRFGDFSAPLDEALVHVSLDLSGRPHLSYDLKIPTERVGTYDTQLAGKNSHHIIEATFKAFARALRQATEFDLRRQGSIPSSKGVLSRS